MEQLNAKVWVVVNEFKDGTSEIVGVYSDLGEAMFQSHAQKDESIKENYLQQHQVQSGQGNVMNLKEMNEWIKKEEAE
ncbi:hypothetical protein [Carnobacterium inhibens]|uniref:hypothetical protein n=1 Tax=Carnobacterium inhibens TaxID=147709 RepID=UPI00203CD264|nr:hypothetical protein [Carnobacterium inhibens]MCM3511661.1 hypothetical protein [Carnobacterium inhibens]